MEDEMIVTDPPIGYKMRRMRDIVGGKQEIIAIEIGVTQQAVSSWENSSQIKRSTLEKYAKAIGVDPQRIIEFEDSKPMSVYNNCEISSSNNGGTYGTLNIQLPAELVDALKEMLLSWNGNKNNAK